MEITQEQIKDIANGILKYIKQVCQQNNITFFLAYGTALGAVRHAGFIPWDDDIDIFMTRENYDKFASVVNEQPNSNYRLLYLDEPKYTLPLAKVIDKRTVLHQDRQREFIPLGIYVDVFIIDNIPDAPKARSSYYKNLDFLLRYWNIFQYKREYPKKGVGNKLKRMVYDRINPRWFSVAIDKLAKKYNSKFTQQVGVMTYPGINRQVNCFPRKWIESVTTVSFEGEEYPVFGDIDEFLTQLYGDWRSFPPIEKRVSHHAYRAHFQSENNN